MVVAKRQREKPSKIEQRKVQGAGVRTSGKANSPPGSHDSQRVGRIREQERHTKREAKTELRAFSLFFWVGPASHVEDVLSFTF